MAKTFERLYGEKASTLKRKCHEESVEMSLYRISPAI